MRLNLSCCEELKEIHPSIGNLGKLILLNLSNCYNLKKLPNFNQVSSLRSLDLSYCKALRNFPEIKAKTTHLVELNLVSVGMIEFPSSIQLLHGLKLQVGDCQDLESLFNGFCELKNLKVLKCYSPVVEPRLPENLGHLIWLEYLNLKDSYFVDLPKSFSQLPRLKYLNIKDTNIYELPKLPANIREVYACSTFAFGRNIAKVASECSSLYSVSIHGYDIFKLAKEFIHFPFCSKNPFCISYKFNSILKYATVMETYILGSFKHQCYASNGISINLNPSWYNKNFVGFVIYFGSLKDDMWEAHPDKDIVGDHIKHYLIIVKLSSKDNENEVLQTECVMAKKDCFRRGGHMCFACIPISSLWSKSETKMNSATLDEYSRLEVKLRNSTASRNWGCSLLYER